MSTAKIFADRSAELSNTAVRLRELLEAVSGKLRTAFSSGTWIVAEAQDIRTPESGHVYLTLVDPVDTGATAKANLWNSQGGNQYRKAVEARGEPLRKGEKLFCWPSLKSIRSLVLA
jgi:exonuclease VII large subunit